uniref:Putative salivary lipocalin n=1 Tax=Ixodes ricinus TaxID=34613 RepID=A0A0K8RKY9_IXORI
MALRLSTVLCIMSAALFHLPEAQSKPNPETKYDAWKELDTRFSIRYYLTHRSYQVDTKLGGRARCVSVLKLSRVPFTERINALFVTKPNRYSDPPTNLQVKMTAYSSTGSGTKNMIKTTYMDDTTLYIQKLVYTDNKSCRVLIHTAEGNTHCQLWVHHEAAASVSRGCKEEYRKYCTAEYPIFNKRVLE